jgi:hypothetical protein
VGDSLGLPLREPDTEGLRLPLGEALSEGLVELQAGSLGVLEPVAEPRALRLTEA